MSLSTKPVWAYDVPPPAAKRTYLEEAGGWKRWNKSSELVPKESYSCIFMSARTNAKENDMNIS